MKEKPTTKTPVTFPFLAGGGEMGGLMRSKDWSKTLVGTPDTWPQSLKSTVRTILHSKFAMWLWWGPDLVQFYNDAYRPSLGKTGEKHPHALGQPGEETWGEIWPIIKPQIDQVLQTGEATWNINHLVPINRNNILEEVYWTYSYSPVYDDNDNIGGVLVTVTETSQQVIGERQLMLLQELATKTMQARTVRDACLLAIEALETNQKDIPFSLIYLVDENSRRLHRLGASGFEEGAYQAAKTFTIDDSVWPFAAVITSGKPVVVENKTMSTTAETSWQTTAHKSVVLPLNVAGHENARGVVVLGLNPMRLYDDNYESFTNLIASQVASAIGNAEVYENERKRSEALAAIDRAKTIFFSNVSHEFRTPLTLMLGPLQDLMNDKSAGAFGDVTGMIYRNGLRLQKLVNALLDFSRIEAGRFEASYTPINISSYTAELVSNFRSAIEKAGIKFTVAISPVSGQVYADRGMWEKIIFNLLSNAFKFTFNGEIKVAINDGGEYVLLSVSDTGVGIDKEDLSDIFTRFKRIEGTRSRSIEGSGIGLSLVYELVKLHGGTIDVDSEKGKGTTFSITIPKGAQHLPADQVKNQTGETRIPDFAAYIQESEQWVADWDTSLEHAPAYETTGSEEKPRIVVADDNADMRRYITRLLSGRFNVVCVSNADAALRAIYQEYTDLLITDIMMSGMDGIELLKTLKNNRQTARLPVVVLSALADEQARLQCIEAGADDYLVKPFNANELLARATSIISSNQARRETESRIYELLMQAPAAMAVMRGPDHVFELSNPAYFHVVGKERAILGKPISEALPEIVEQGIVKILDEVYQTGKPFYGNELLVRLDQEGTGELKDVYFNFVYQPIRNSKHEVEGILVHAVDITKQVEAKNRIIDSEGKYKTLFEKLDELVKERTRELERSNEDLQQFAHVASHDLKEPVRKIKVFANMLERQFSEVLPAAGKNYLQKMHASADRMKSMIDGVLTYSLSNNQATQQMEMVDLNAVLKSVEKELELLLQEKQGILRVSELPKVEGVDILLYQLFYNLVNNALKFSKAGLPPVIDVTANLQPETGSVMINVADNGIGFDAIYAARIFNPFIRLNAKEEYEGSGLGLALCKKIAERHSGNIMVKSIPGVGSVFHVQLPITQEKKNI